MADVARLQEYAAASAAAAVAAAAAAAAAAKGCQQVRDLVELGTASGSWLHCQQNVVPTQLFVETVILYLVRKVCCAADGLAVISRHGTCRLRCCHESVMTGQMLLSLQDGIWHTEVSYKENGQQLCIVCCNPFSLAGICTLNEHATLGVIVGVHWWWLQALIGSLQDMLY